MIKDIWSTSLLRDFSDQDFEEFQEIVLKDVKNKLDSNEYKTILLNNLDLWLYCLQILRKEIELHLSQHKSGIHVKIYEMKEKGSSSEEIEEALLIENKWRSNAVKFLNSVEKRMLYVKLLIQEEDDINEDE